MTPPGPWHRRHRRLVLAAAGVLAIALVGGGAWLLRPPETEPRRRYNVHQYFDGTVDKVTRRELTVTTDEGRTYTMDVDRKARLDVPHIRRHSRLGLRTRVYWELRKGEPVVVFADDSPLDDLQGREPRRGASTTQTTGSPRE